MKNLSYAVYIFLRSSYVIGVPFGAKLFVCLILKRDVRVRVPGHNGEILVRGGTSDGIVAFATFVKKEYLIVAVDRIETILDLGANVGYAAIFFSIHYPSARIVALEPDPINFSILVANTKACSNVLCLNEGVWWRDAFLSVVDRDEESYALTFEEVGSGQGVPSTTVSSLIRTYQPTGGVMVKMDIEGAEKEIFESDTEWLSDCRILQLEIHGCWKSVFDAFTRVQYDARISGENLVFEIT